MSRSNSLAGLCFVACSAALFAQLTDYSNRLVRAGDDCDYKCEQNPDCNKADVACKFCDPPGPGASCSDDTFKDYDPGAHFIQRTVDGNEERTFNDNVTCVTSQACGQGSPISTQACLGAGDNCVSPSPTFCQKCAKDGMPTDTPAADYNCSGC